MAKTKKSEKNPPSKPVKAKSPKKSPKKPARKVFQIIDDVGTVEEKEVPTKVTVGGTQESEVVVSKGKTKRKSQPKKKDIISPAVGENEVEAEVDDSKETQSDEDIQMERPAADQVMNKEGQTRKKFQKQVARTGPAAKRDKTDVLLARPFASESLQEEDTKKNPSEELAIPMDLDGGMTLMLRTEANVEPRSSKMVEIERDDGEPEGQRDGKERLRIPLSRLVRSCMDSMIGAANRATIRALRSVRLKHKFACLCRSMAETSLLMGDVLYNAVRTDARRCRKTDRLMEEEIKELKIECDSTFEISTQIKADVDMVMQENQTLESKNEGLKTAFEGEKVKVKTLEDKVKELQRALEKEKKGKDKAENEVVSVTHKLNKLKEAKVKVDSSLVEKTRENEKLQTALTQVTVSY
ncbi:hypothetical protein Dimus_024651 [Dionaea muscipula]